MYRAEIFLNLEVIKGGESIIVSLLVIKKNVREMFRFFLEGLGNVYRKLDLFLR